MAFGINGGGDRIIQPKKRIVARVVIEVDVDGKTICSAQNLPLVGPPTVLHPLSLCSLLAQLVASYLMPLNAELNDQLRGNLDAQGNPKNGTPDAG